MVEDWKQIPGAANGYEVSNLGRVRSPRKVLRPGKRPSGHLVAWVKGLGVKYVHQLVLLAFVGERPVGAVTLHMDHVPSNNALTNLQYGSVSENLKMDIAAGRRLHVSQRGEKHAAAKLSDASVDLALTSSLTAKELAPILGVTPHHLRAIRRGASRRPSGQNQPSQQMEKTMAKAPKTLSKAEIKAKTNDLKAARKVVLDTFAPFESDVKAAEKALAVARKEADKAVAAAQKAADVATKKREKASAARDKGLAKIDAELATLASAPKEEAAV